MSIEEEEEVFEPIQEWYNIKNYDHALDLNIRFLSGELNSSIYHYSPVYDMNNDDLIYLHKYCDVFTHNGQSSECIYNKIITKGPYVGKYYFSKQKPYLDGFIRAKYLEKLIIYLDKLVENGIPIMYSFKNKENIFSNYELKGYWLTRDAVSDDIVENLDELKFKGDSHTYDDSFDEICETVGFKENIKKEIYSFFIFINEYCYDMSITKILIDFFNQNIKRSRKSRTYRKTRTYKRSRTLKKSEL